MTASSARSEVGGESGNWRLNASHSECHPQLEPWDPRGGNHYLARGDIGSANYRAGQIKALITKLLCCNHRKRTVVRINALGPSPYRGARS